MLQGRLSAAAHAATFLACFCSAPGARASGAPEPALPTWNSLVNLTTSGAPGLYIRYCGGYLSTYAYAQDTSADGSLQSFQLQLVPTVCQDAGVPGAVSFASLNSQASYLVPLNNGGQLRLGLSSMQTLLNWPQQFDACFAPVASVDPSRPDEISFMSLSHNKAFAGLYVSVGAGASTGSCANNGGKDVILAAAGASGLASQSWAVQTLPPLPAPPAASVTIQTGAIDHVIERAYAGCHIGECRLVKIVGDGTWLSLFSQRPFVLTLLSLHPFL